MKISYSLFLRVSTRSELTLNFEKHEDILEFLNKIIGREVLFEAISNKKDPSWFNAMYTVVNFYSQENDDYSVQITGELTHYGDGFFKLVIPQ